MKLGRSILYIIPSTTPRPVVHEGMVKSDGFDGFLKRGKSEPRSL